MTTTSCPFDISTCTASAPCLRCGRLGSGKRYFTGAARDHAKPQYWEGFDTYEEALADAKSWTTNDEARAVWARIGKGWSDFRQLVVIEFRTTREVIEKDAYDPVTP